MSLFNDDDFQHIEPRITDRELLVLAAKAAGIARSQWDYEWVRGLGHMVCRSDMWSPLTDDGDALRLAVKLGLLFTYMHDRFELFQRLYLEDLDNDNRPQEATRRAIVRAAAEIGRTMP
jgi:hypothetical protein